MPSLCSILSLPKTRRLELIRALTPAELRYVCYGWRIRARTSQLPPDGDWTTWLFMGGRGAGKTRAGAEWVLERIAYREARRVALIGETLSDVRDVMIGGPSGLRAVALYDSEEPRFLKSERKLIWRNGAEARMFSAEDPDSLRGHAFDLAWCDEFAKWRYAQETFDNLQMCLREGERPRALVTTTPRNRPELRALLEMPDLAVTHARSRDNWANLSKSYFTRVVARYAGTALGRQELDGEVLDDLDGALWTRGLIEKARVRQAPELTRIVIAVDPPVSIGPKADECGIIAAGLGADGIVYVLADVSVQGRAPKAWATRALAQYEVLKADCIVAETNQGGQLVREVFAGLDAGAPIREVHASRGKTARAEPVAVLYEQARVKHVGAFPELEDQLCSLGAKEAGPGSPDRADALVWAVTELALRKGPVVRVRGL
jgi:phage terminase large subunit-like protein